MVLGSYGLGLKAISVRGIDVMDNDDICCIFLAKADLSSMAIRL